MEGGVGADLVAVTWEGGGAWQAFLLFWRARAQKAEHVVWARPLPLRPRLSGCGCSACVLGSSESVPAVLDVTLVLFHTLFQADVDLAIPLDGMEVENLETY